MFLKFLALNADKGTEKFPYVIGFDEDLGYWIVVASKWGVSPKFNKYEQEVSVVSPRVYPLGDVWHGY